MAKKQEVAIGILCDDQGRLLVGRRLRDPQAGKWEMPGGKVEAGETVIEALKREFREEGGVELDEIAHWTNIEHDNMILYLYRVFTKNIFVATIYDECDYVASDALADLDWITSNLEFTSDLSAILKKDIAIDRLTYVAEELNVLLDGLTALVETWNSRSNFARIDCVLYDDALLFPNDRALREKIDLMYHEGIEFFAPSIRPIMLPSYFKRKERGYP